MLHSSDSKRAKNVMQMLGLKERIVQAAIASSVRLNGCVLRREDGHTLRL